MSRPVIQHGRAFQRHTVRLQEALDRGELADAELELTRLGEIVAELVRDLQLVGPPAEQPRPARLH